MIIKNRNELWPQSPLREAKKINSLPLHEKFSRLSGLSGRVPNYAGTKGFVTCGSIHILYIIDNLYTVINKFSFHNKLSISSELFVIFIPKAYLFFICTVSVKEKIVYCMDKATYCFCYIWCQFNDPYTVYTRIGVYSWLDISLEKSMTQ